MWFESSLGHVKYEEAHVTVTTVICINVINVTIVAVTEYAEGTNEVC